MAIVDHSKSKELPRFDHRIVNLTGKSFTRLTVIRFAGRTSTNLIVWECLCECGNIMLATSNGLRHKIIRSRVRSCGCLAIDVTRDRSIRHGMTGTPTYDSWRAIVFRCENPNCAGFKDYGGRGITVCKRWRESFEAFHEDMGDKPDGLEIDRIDNNGNYEPENCKWSTRTEQARNRRSNHFLTFQGETLCVAEWEERTGLTHSQIQNRLTRGWPVEKILTEPVRQLAPRGQGRRRKGS